MAKIIVIYILTDPYQTPPSIINTANVIQFPLKLAFASTAHKIQGSTISKPQKAVINTSDSFGAAMIYVMLSRVCSLDQIRILNEFDESKMYPHKQALEEMKRLECISFRIIGCTLCEEMNTCNGTRTISSRQIISYKRLYLYLSISKITFINDAALYL